MKGNRRRFLWINGLRDLQLADQLVVEFGGVMGEVAEEGVNGRRREALGDLQLVGQFIVESERAMNKWPGQGANGIRREARLNSSGKIDWRTSSPSVSLSLVDMAG
jgi:hypothetical protein